MLTIEQKVDLLKSLNVFSEVPKDVLTIVADVLEDVQLANGETLFHQGDEGDKMYIIVEGIVRIYAKKQIIAERGPHEIIGEMSLFDSSPRSASAAAVRDSYLLALGRGPFRELLASYPHIVYGLIKVLTDRLRETIEKLGMSPYLLNLFERIENPGTTLRNRDDL